MEGFIVAPQTTIRQEVSIDGVGIHTGKNIKIVLKPAKADSGISFIRTDISNSPVIRLGLSNLSAPSSTDRRTILGEGKARIETVEHLLAALSGIEIDNVVVELNGSELPGLDGSAKCYVDKIKEAGRVTLNADRKLFYVREPICVEDNGSRIVVLPDINLRISYTLHYPKTSIKTQYNSFIITPEIFEKEIAPSRTFCVEEEVESLLKAGLGKGASYENTLVLGKDGVIKNKIRFEDEFLRHKVLDLIGDLSVFGMQVKGHILCVKSGHALNIKLVEKIDEQMRAVKVAAPKGLFKTPLSLPKSVMNAEDIKNIIPHRYPFLLIDSIVELTGKRVVGIKNLSENDYFFAGHFPSIPVMPGVLIIEAMAQTGGVLLLNKKENAGKIAYFMSINNVKFRRVVNPGDQLRLEINIVKFKTKVVQFKGTAYVGDQLVAEADLICALGK